jgi:16S rRNA (cytosine967-C5)-methyltransferase
MRPGGRLQAAIEIIEDIERRHRPAADALRDWGLSHRFAGSADRAAIGNLVYDALRRRRSAGALLGAETARAMVIGAHMLENRGWMLPDRTAEGDRFAPDPLTGAERAAIDAFDPDRLADAVRADIPDWCVGQFQAAFGDAWPGEGAALASRPPLDLRANRLKASREKVLAQLARHGASACPIAPDGIRIAPIAGEGRHPNIQAEAGFQKGWFEVQDEGSQLAALLAATGTGDQFLDFCAGGGGKTLALSAILANRGQIFAHDADRQRLAPIFERVRRAGCRNVQVVSGKAELASLAGRMDLVLVDAPCTGSGTWRRRPDAKWRLGQRQLEARMAEQDAVLDEAAAHVRPAGRLAYVTCSLFPCENEERIDAFLERSPGFAAADPRRIWDEAVGAHGERVRFGRRGILLSPARTGTDGFFIAVMTRQN